MHRQIFPIDNLTPRTSLVWRLTHLKIGAGDKRLRGQIKKIAKIYVEYQIKDTFKQNLNILFNF